MRELDQKTTKPVFSYLLGICAALLVACGGSDPGSEEHLQRAKAALAEADAATAYLELKNTLQLDAQSAEARWLLGKFYLDMGATEEADKELLRAQELGWATQDITLARSQALLSLKRYQEVIALDPAELDSSGAAKVLAAQSLAALGMGDLENARELARQAQQKNPQGVASQIAAAALLSSEGKPTKSLEMLRLAVETEPENARAWHLLGQALLDRARHVQARDAFSKAIDLRPLWIDPRVNRALVNLRLGERDSARDDIAQVVESAPDHPAVNYAQGLFYLEDKDYRQLIDAHTKALPLAENYPLINYSLARAYFLTGKDADALPFAKEYNKAFPNNIEGRKLLAALKLRREEYSAAQELLEPVIDQNPTELESLSMLAIIYAHNAEIERAMSLYSWIANLPGAAPVSKVPDNSDLARVALAAHTSSSTESSESNLLHPEDSVLRVLGYMLQQDYKQAIAAARDMQLSDPTGLGSYHILAKVYLAAGREKDARNTLENALKRDPHDPVSNLLMAEFARSQGKLGGVRYRYRNILEEHPYHLQTLLRMAALELEEGNEAAYLTNLGIAMRTHPDAIIPRINMATYYLHKGEPGEAEEIFATISELQRNAPRIYSLELLAQLAGGEHALDQPTVDNLLTAQPGSEGFYYLLVNAASRKGRLAETKAELKKQQRRNNRHMSTLVGLAQAAQIEGDHAELVTYTQLLARLHPNPELPLILRLRAAAASTQGDYQEAIALTERAFEALPQAALQLDLSGYQVKAGDLDAAAQGLKTWLADHPDDLPVKMGLAQTREMQGDLIAARDYYREILAQNPNQFVALNNLAWIIREEDPAQALKLSERAQKLAPTHAGVLDTLAVIQYLNNKPIQALSSIQKALIIMPDNLSMQYHRAQILAGLGKKEQAIGALETLLNQDPAAFPEYAEAQSLLTSLQG